MSRWIYEVGPTPVMQNKFVVEMGAGVGLPGILAGRFASKVVLTDYIQTVLDNLRYNVQINTNCEEAQNEQQVEQKKKMLAACEVMYLNWYDIDYLIYKDAESKQQVSSSQVEQQLKSVQQIENKDIRPEEFTKMLPGKHCCELMLGSELTYTSCTETISHLAKMADFYMKPGSAFVEILSTDRDGVALFCEEIKKYQFTYKVYKVPERYMGNFKTKQRPEEYRFYVFMRESDIDSPDVKLTCASFGAKAENE